MAISKDVKRATSRVRVHFGVGAFVETVLKTIMAHLTSCDSSVKRNASPWEKTAWAIAYLRSRFNQQLEVENEKARTAAYNEMKEAKEAAEILRASGEMDLDAWKPTELEIVPKLVSTKRDSMLGHVYPEDVDRMDKGARALALK